LPSIGINGNALNCIRFYLSNRKYYAKISHIAEQGNVVKHKSDIKNWCRGSPQDTPMGPIIFLLLINTLSAHVTQKLIQKFHDKLISLLSCYADDIASCFILLARCKMQDARSKMQEARSQKPEARSKEQGARSKEIGVPINQPPALLANSFP
jgi:hypothetical protein